MIQTFHVFPVRSATVSATTVDTIIGLRDNTTAALEIDSDFVWLMQV